MLTDRRVIFVILAVQVSGATFFLWQMAINILGIHARPLSWKLVELIEIGAATGLLLGSVLGWVALTRTMQRSKQVEDQLRAASGAFMELLEERFAGWGLTPAEHDVAMFSIKGLSTQDIAALRQTSEGTVKAQTNAIYRKAGVTGRPQLLSLFIDELMGDALMKD